MNKKEAQARMWLFQRRYLYILQHEDKRKMYALTKAAEEFGYSEGYGAHLIHCHTIKPETRYLKSYIEKYKPKVRLSDCGL